MEVSLPGADPTSPRRIQMGLGHWFSQDEHNISLTWELIQDSPKIQIPRLHSRPSELAALAGAQQCAFEEALSLKGHQSDWIKAHLTP